MKFINTKYQKHARKILANNIRYFRLKKNWSQEDFADELGTTPTYISNLENAKRNMRVDYIGHIADTLGVQVNDLFIDRPSVNNARVPRR
ncbi:MAG: helix-turn-helix transcriptional regulator [Bacilli bacterium]|nr:helix-turn-helix transcriptional regulator [Bacilli bacterium]